MKAPHSHLARQRFAIRGRVQGVGFRPHVYRLAVQERLAGCVGNDSHGAFIEVEGSPPGLARFAQRLREELPPLATIQSIQQTDIPVQHLPGFRIVESRRAASQQAEISPDVATCADCLHELFTPTDRRYHYPFINCTNCGPRYSIVSNIPYDRPQTTMGAFTMCAACQAEYDDPANRRFHAQPNACPQCGPRVWLADSDGLPLAGGTDHLSQARAWLQAGKVLAIKGLGGFHLACRADLDDAVRAVRTAKGREAKPFALMATSLQEAHRHVHLSAAAEALLASWRAPIILAPRRPDAPICRAVAPGSQFLGIMLPYTPLHHLLVTQSSVPLVMTSANPSDEPLCADNDEAIKRLRGMVHGFLLHDRQIARRLDDSVTIATLQAAPIPIRRSRGYVPEPLTIPFTAAEPVLSLGGDLKSAICLLQGRQAILSEHLGELANPAAYRNFTAAVERLRHLLDIQPAVVACDLHPGYLSSAFAKTLGLPQIRVQHHHAHAVACMAEHGLTSPVIALCADGTGYGDDGTIWGCELLLADALDFQRLGHLQPFPLLGGDEVAIDTWRPALSLLIQAHGHNWRNHCPGFPDDAATRLAEQRLLAGAGTLASSLGRLFDAVACLLGVVHRNRYEAEAAMALENLAQASSSTTILNYGWQAHQWDHRPLLQDLLDRQQTGASQADLARAFHNTLAAMFADGIQQTAGQHRVAQIVLAGGCFHNCLLSRLLRQRLEQHGLQVYTHAQLTPGDGSLALGQACIAAARREK